METMRVLVVSMGDPIMTFVHSGFLKAGAESHIIDASVLTLADVSGAIDSFKPDFCLINNFDIFSVHPEGDFFEDLFRSKSLPVLSWYFESPELAGKVKLLMRWLRGPFPSGVSFMVTDSHFTDFFKARGSQAFHLPLAVDEAILNRKFNDDVLQSRLTDADSVLFSGSALLPEGNYKTEEDRLNTFVGFASMEFQHLIGRQFSSEYEAMFKEGLREIFNHWTDMGLNFRNKRSEIVKAIMALLPEGGARDALTVYQSRIDVLFSFFQLGNTLEYVSSRLPLQLHGSDEWSRFNIRTLTPAKRLTNDELYSCFSKSFAVLCHTKHCFVRFVHERVLMTYATGGFPITDHREDLWTIFKPGGVATYSDIREIPEIFSFYQRHVDSRQKMIASAREIISSAHTYDHRAQSILEIARKLQFKTRHVRSENSGKSTFRDL